MVGSGNLVAQGLGRFCFGLCGGRGGGWGGRGEGGVVGPSGAGVDAVAEF